MTRPPIRSHASGIEAGRGLPFLKRLPGRPPSFQGLAVGKPGTRSEGVGCPCPVRTNPRPRPWPAKRPGAGTRRGQGSPAGKPSGKTRPGGSSAKEKATRARPEQDRCRTLAPQCLNRGQRHSSDACLGTPSEISSPRPMARFATPLSVQPGPRTAPCMLVGRQPRRATGRRHDGPKSP